MKRIWIEHKICRYQNRISETQLRKYSVYLQLLGNKDDMTQDERWNNCGS